MGALLDKLLEGLSPEEVMGKEGLMQELQKGIMERMLEGELTAHLGYEKHAQEGRIRGNSRNGHTRNRVRTGTAEVEIEVPRDREGKFEPVLVPKGQRRLFGFDENVLSLYARGMTTREIQGHLEEVYGVEVSPTLISTVTDAVLDEVKAWQARPLGAVYPMVFLDAIHVKGRVSGHIQAQAVYLALTVRGEKELLGLWVGEAEGAKFWLSILTELKNRGVQDILIAAVDGLTGFPEAIATVFRQTQVQLCIVHRVRGSLRYVAWQERFPMISRKWRTNWANLIPFFDYPPELRRVMYTTNAVEALNAQMRKVTKKRGAFPTSDAVRKVMYLALQRASRKCTRPVQDWTTALNHLAHAFPGRVPV